MHFKKNPLQYIIVLENEKADICNCFFDSHLADLFWAGGFSFFDFAEGVDAGRRA